jgi:hypothetical protein
MAISQHIMKVLMKKLKPFWGDITFYTVILFSYAAFVIRLGWVKPPPSDQLEYLQGVEWGTTVGFWPWLDRVALGASIGFLRLIPLPVYHTGPAYAFFISSASLLYSMLWLQKRYGFGSAWVFALTFFSSWYAYFFGSQVFPEPTQIFFSILAIFPLIDYLETSDKKYLKRAAFFSAWAALTKITSLLLPVLLLFLVWKKAKDRNEIKEFIKYFTIGVISIFVIFTLAYGPASTWDMVREFFVKNFSFMYKGRSEANNIVSYLEVVLNKSFLPVLLSLFIFSGVYKEKIYFRLALFAWFFFLILYGIHIISGRGGPVINNYMYPTFFFAALTFAAYVGKNVVIEGTAAKIKWTAISIFLLSAGIGIASSGKTTHIFQPGYIGFLTYPLKVFFNSGLLLIVVLPLLFEIKKSSKVAKALVIAMTLWCTAFNVGSLRKYFREVLFPEANFYYDNMEALTLVDAKEYNIYIEAWHTASHAERIVWGVYRHFFRDKYVHEGVNAQILNEQEVKSSISFLNNEKEIAAAKHKTFLTDKPEIIQKYFPSSLIQTNLNWKGLNLFIVEVKP